ncbi:unnamed protein product [Eruca vesicaria subsp. sativa]|uniref:Uncharacterized protein n=1 Tax=Eruca vesicaria subsp. sativa TaxID=29727 RepID=A0ABC8J0F6_ERUVS|nr:unnamed protein product [Eruca vesicaria subsp. sativa]
MSRLHPIPSWRCSSAVEARLLRNIKRGGELMWMDLLIVDINVSGFLFSSLYQACRYYFSVSSRLFICLILLFPGNLIVSYF